ncbi:MAG: COX15/CtaA family protein [Microbacteriaceae bacterium]
MTAQQTPLGWAAARWSLGPRALRRASTAALLVSVLIVFTGGVVRVTGSGLGCPSWPSCTASSLTTTPELGIHGLIEFGNRMFTGLIVLTVAAVIVAARLQRPEDRAVTRLAWSQFWLVVANAIAGGVTVLLALNPWVVAAHFVLAMALLATTTLTWHRARHPGAERAAVDAGTRSLAVALVAVTLVLILVGTLVAGSGPHSGDSSDVPRMGLPWVAVTLVHGLLGALTLLLALALLARGRTPRPVRRRTGALLLVVALQGTLGIVQAATGLPAGLVSVHLLGAALVWVGALRVLLEAEPRLFAARPASPAGAAERVPGPAL